MPFCAQGHSVSTSLSDGCQHVFMGKSRTVGQASSCFLISLVEAGATE